MMERMGLATSLAVVMAAVGAVVKIQAQVGEVTVGCLVAVAREAAAAQTQSLIRQAVMAHAAK